MGIFCESFMYKKKGLRYSICLSVSHKDLFKHFKTLMTRKERDPTAPGTAL